MSQYFSWVNLSKKQYLADDIWPDDMGFWQNSHSGCLKLDAACTLISKEWAGDLVAFIGDYFLRSAISEVDAHRRLVWEAMGNKGLDACMDEGEWEDVSGRFAFARGKTRTVYGGESDPYGEKVAYEGPFDLEIEHFRFVVNEDKGEYFDRRGTSIESVRGGFVCRFELLPGLLCCGAGFREHEGEDLSGTWIGDRIVLADEAPEGYRDISRSAWMGEPWFETDEEALAPRGWI